MTPGAHLVLSWLSSVNIVTDSRERRIVTYAGLSPDLDGIGLIADKLTGETTYYEQFHHYIGHCGVAALIVPLIAMYFAKIEKLRVLFLSFFVFHVHILCDIVGSKGSDGYQWPIYYLYPFDASFELTWSGQWELNAWQNSVIMATSLGACLYIAAKRRYSFMEVFGKRFDKEVFKMYSKYISKQQH